MNTPFEITTRPKRTLLEKFRDSYAMFRVALARLMRGDKPRFKQLLFN
jgi:hypothetical protein